MKACQRQLHVRWGCRHNIVRIPKQCHGVYHTATFRGLPHTTSSTGGFDSPYSGLVVLVVAACEEGLPVSLRDLFPAKSRLTLLLGQAGQTSSVRSECGVERPQALMSDLG